MNRRQLLTGLGGLTATGGLALGSGAFTSVNANRNLTVDVADDSYALLSLVPVLHYIPETQSDVVSEDSDGTLQIDVTAGGASGVNVDATTWIGTPNYDDESGWVDVSNDGFDSWNGGDRDHGYTPKAAFAMVNHGTQPYNLSLEYSPANQTDSTITFHVYDGWAPEPLSNSNTAPRKYGEFTFPTAGDTHDLGTTGHNSGKNFAPGKRIFTSIEIDTVGGSTAEDLSGDLTIHAEAP